MQGYDIFGRRRAAVKHPGHDQKSHGNWARGGGIRPRKGTGVASFEEGKARIKRNEAAFLNGEEGIAPPGRVVRGGSPNDVARGINETRYDLGLPMDEGIMFMNNATATVANSPWEAELVVAKDVDIDSTAAVLSLEHRGNESYIGYLGSAHTMPGAGSAVIREAARIAAERGNSLVGHPTSGAMGFWEGNSWMPIEGSLFEDEGVAPMGWTADEVREIARD